MQAKRIPLILLITLVGLLAFAPAAYAPPSAGLGQPATPRPPPRIEHRPAKPDSERQDIGRSPYHETARSGVESREFQSNYFIARAHSELSKGAVRAYRESTDYRSRALDLQLPGLQIRLPHNDDFDKEILPYAWYRFAPGLLAPLKRENVHVISLVRDPATSEAFASKIPQTSQLKIRDLEDILTGNSKLGQTGLRDALKPLSEEVLLIIGHVNSGKFEYKNEKGQIVQTPFDELFAAANENKVNLVPLGCESSIWAPIGLSHKINSIDVVTALGNYFTQPSDNSDVYGLFRSITGPNMILTVDPVNFQLYQRIEVSRQDGNVVAELYWAPPQTITPETMTTIAKQIATKHLPAPPWIREKLAAYHRAYSFGFDSLIGALLISLLLGIFDSSMMEEEDYLPALFVSHVFFGFCLLGLALIWVSTEAGVSFPLILSLIFLALLVGGWRIGNIWRVRFTVLLVASILLLRAKLML